MTAAVNSSDVTTIQTNNHTFSSTTTVDRILSQDVLSTMINANNLAIVAQNDITLVSADFNIKDTASIISLQGDINILAQAYTNAQSHSEDEESFGELLSSNSTDTYTITQHSGSDIQAGNIVIKGQMLTLAGSQLTADTVDIAAQALNIIDLEATENYSHTGENSGVLLLKTEKSGYIKGSSVNALISVNDALILNNQNVTNQLSADNILSSTTIINSLTDMQLNQLQATLTDEEWDESQVALSKLGTLIVQAVATYVTAGMATGINGIAGSVATSLGGNAIVGSATAAAINSLSTQVISQLLESAITGNPLELDLGDLMTNALKAGLTAGIIDGVTPEFYEALDIPGGVPLNKLTLGEQLTKNVADSLIGAGTGTLIYGGDFGDAFISSFTNNAAADAFSFIGHNLYENEEYKDIPLPPKAVTHALVGGVASKLQGGDFTAGAIATATGHIVSEYARDYITQDVINGKISIDTAIASINALSKVVGGATAIAYNKDITPEELANVTDLSSSVAMNNGLKGIRTLWNVGKKLKDKLAKNGEIDGKDLKDALKSEGLDIIANFDELFNSDLSITDIWAITNLVVGFDGDDVVDLAKEIGNLVGFEVLDTTPEPTIGGGIHSVDDTQENVTIIPGSNEDGSLITTIPGSQERPDIGGVEGELNDEPNIETFPEDTDAGEVQIYTADDIKKRNGHLTGQNHPVTGVPFDTDGYPVFDSKEDVIIDMTGNRYIDEKSANLQANYEETPAGYSWHHHQDGKTMQLVDKWTHQKTGHTGGASIVKNNK